MSLQPILQKLLSEKKLFELTSLDFGDEIVRTMIVSPGVDAAVMYPFPDTELGLRQGEFRATLDAFSEGAEFSVIEDPSRKKGDAMLARVHPVDREFWSIRVTSPDDTPGIRVFGAFVEKDVFVALTWEYRESIIKFNDEVKAISEAWIDLFGSQPPLKGTSLNAYLTNFRAV